MGIAGKPKGDEAGIQKSAIQAMCGVVSERLRESCFPGCGVGHGRSFQETSFTDDRVVIADDARGGGRGRHRVQLLSDINPSRYTYAGEGREKR